MSLLGTKKTIRVRGASDTPPHTHTHPGVDRNANLGFHNNLQFPCPSVVSDLLAPAGGKSLRPWSSFLQAEGDVRPLDGWTKSREGVLSSRLGS